MATPGSISVSQVMRLVGTPDAPGVVDVRIDDEHGLEFGVHTDALDRLAMIVRAADTGEHDLAPQAAGLLAAPLGFSRMYRDDLAQLDAAMGLYDAFYRWARDAVGETHNWPIPGFGVPA